jgi:transposase, IS5 family
VQKRAHRRAVTAVGDSWTPKKSVLHQTISAIRADTWEAINRTVLASAREKSWSLARWCGWTAR